MQAGPSLASRLKYASIIVFPALVLGGMFVSYSLQEGAIWYTSNGTPERRERYRKRQEELERESRKKRLEQRRKEELEKEKQQDQSHDC